MDKRIFGSRRWMLLLSAMVAVLAGSPASHGDGVVTVLNPPRFEIDNGRVTVWYDSGQAVWGMTARDGSVSFSNGVSGVQLGDEESRADRSSVCSAQRELGHDALGDYVRLQVTYPGLPQLDELVWNATLRPDASYAVFSVSARVRSGVPETLRGIRVLGLTEDSAVQFGAKRDCWACFIDSGHQGGTRVAPCFEGEQASHSSPATLLLHDAAAGQSLLLGWLSWGGSNPGVQFTASKAGGVTAVSADCVCHADGLAQLTSEPFFVSVESDPLAALEQYAREVCRANNPPIREDTLMGWLSWYCSRLTMTEEFVLANARVVAGQFRAYGVDTMQVDHGWEYRDVVGHWIANDRFPHGIDWLADELKRLDLQLGVWIAASCVSEHTPFFAGHPNALIRNADGAPSVFVEKWHWAPHGRVFSLDPTDPDARQHYRDSLQPLVDAGVRYYKVDFIGSSGSPSGVFRDPQRTRGFPMLRYEMQQIRDVIGADSWLRYCSAPSNPYCGIVNIGGATVDIGNATGNWEHLRNYHMQLSSCWYKHRTFWHNEPDALIVGEGAENEARLRCAWLALSGGVVALGDDLTRAAPARLAMISKCLPPYDVAARPLDLFEQSPARIWDLTVNAPWDTWHVVGLFNLDQEEISVQLPLARFGLDGVPVTAWEFWTQSMVGAGQNPLTVTVPGYDSRVVAVRRARPHPQILGTDMHLTMGGVDVPEAAWNAGELTLSGIAARVPGAQGTVFVRVPDGYEPVEAGLMRGEGVLAVPIEFADREATWSAAFRAAGNGEGE